MKHDTTSTGRLYVAALNSFVRTMKIACSCGYNGAQSLLPLDSVGSTWDHQRLDLPLLKRTLRSGTHHLPVVPGRPHFQLTCPQKIGPDMMSVLRHNLEIYGGMSRKRYTLGQITGVLRPVEVKVLLAPRVGQVCRTLEITEQTYYRWCRDYGG